MTAVLAATSELEVFGRFCEAVLTTERGRPFVLEPFQRDILGGFFDGASETVCVCPKKQGKSSLLGAVALFHLLSTPFAEVVIVAAARDQASILLRQVTGYIRRSPTLAARLKVKQREVVNDALGGRIRVLASDTDTVDGQIPTLALIDELHRHRSSELYGVLRDGLGPRDGRLIAISTAGDDETSPLGRLRSAALSMPGVVRDGAHKHVSGDHLSYHEWSLEPRDDVDDLDVVLTANPASWITRAELERRQTASMRPWQWRRFTCGVWSHGEDSAFAPAEWAACARPGLTVPDRAYDVVAGLDLAYKQDCTALVACWRDRDGVVLVHPPTILTPPGDGSSLSIETVFSAIAQMAERWPNMTLVADPLAGGVQLLQRVDSELPRIRVAEHSQAHGPMCSASARLGEAVASRRIAHPDDLGLNAHVMACSVRTVGEHWRLAKPRGSDQPIDAAIALAMAHSTIVSEARYGLENRARW